ncbi:MAG: tRNA (N6-isopentenyl adenosine(37)-C2)-methylthiotransferase MiaB [Candidatus Levybacteria bacterium CG10_big_fil_rev_8_21_14_0_10_36_7]|nr:MAG: tRNA (N6-isopentenyl adenosine(37)-C2)-methylthiotransferase MiaB [Candidatus Levybacteria bacterium CG10_big_fil_rev_8_21_14_0_10_36_7]
MKYFVKTFGCQQNTADSERIAGYYESRGYSQAESFEDSDLIVINTCVIREKAEERVYGLVKNLKPLKKKNPSLKIIITGCLVGTAMREPSGKVSKRLKERLPEVDEFLPIDEVGFEYKSVRMDERKALIPISNGCNNFCTFCIVPFSRGREKSRPFYDIIQEARNSVLEGYREIMLLGQNVNSYGADFIKNSEEYILPNGKMVTPVMVKHLGRMRIPTLFPYLLEEVSKIQNLEKLEFISANPWDYSDELIDVIARNIIIDRLLHLPVQAGDDSTLKRMNRWYTKNQYLELIEKIRKKVDDVSFSTDIIVGFPGESKEAFENTVDLVKKVGFKKAYVACYSPRPGTASEKVFPDDVSYEEKKNRFKVLDTLINHKLIHNS